MSTIQPRTATVTIYQGDYLDRLRFLEQQFDAAVRSEKSATAMPRLASDVPESHRLADEHAALSAEAESTALNVTLRALGRREWRTIVAAHPPRDEHAGDAKVGVNEESFKEALVAASILEPELTEDDLDRLSDIDFDRLYLTAFGLNRSPASAPKGLSLPTSPESDGTSN